MIVHADTLLSLKKCADTKDSLIRLLCYDNVMQTIDVEKTQNLERPNDILAVRATEPSLSLGNNTPLRPVNKHIVAKSSSKEEKFGDEHIKKTDNDSNIDSVNFLIEKVRKDNHEKWLITFSNSQVWKQTDSSYLSLHEGDNVIISKGLLGAFYLKKVGQSKQIKVKRKK